MSVSPVQSSFTDIQSFTRRIVNQIGLNYTDSDSNNSTIQTIFNKIQEIEFIEHFFDDFGLQDHFNILRKNGVFEHATKKSYWKEIDLKPTLASDPYNGHETISEDRKIHFAVYQLPNDFYYKIKFNFNSQLNVIQDITNSPLFGGGTPPFTKEWIGAYDTQWVRTMSESLRNSRVSTLFGNDLDISFIRYGSVYTSLLYIDPVCLRYIPMNISYILQDTTRKIKNAYEYYILYWLSDTQNGIINKTYVTEEKKQTFFSKKQRAYNDLINALNYGLF